MGSELQTSRPTNRQTSRTRSWWGWGWEDEALPPDTVRKLVAQRERWQRVILETWWAYRHMCFNRRYGAVGLLLSLIHISEPTRP